MEPKPVPLPASPLGTDTALLAVRFLGGLQVRRNDHLLPRPFPTRKTASLFAFLLLHPRIEFSRDFLAATFWPKVDEDAAHQSLRAALVPIRRLLEPRPEEKGRFLVSHHDTLLLLPPPDCWVDVWAFEQAAAQAKNAPAGSAEWFALLERAVELYEGDLLPDQGEEWCAVQREELRQGLLACLHDLTRADEQRHQLDRAGGWARRALAADRCDEESHRHLMRFYYRSGEYATAMHQYRACRQALLEVLDAPPSAETIALYQWLSAQRDRDGGVPRLDVDPIPDPLDLMVPLVGRGHELERLHAGWERTRAGRGELILLTGEAGIGKSRLGRQFLQQVALSGGLALYGQSSTLENGALYRPLIDPLRRALELATQHGLTLCAPVWLAQVARLLPEIEPGGETPIAAEGASPRLLEEGMAQFLLTLAAQRPVSLFLDDLQWADAATGRFLHSLAHQSQQARILLIGAYREGEVPGSDWLGPWVTQIEAQPLATSLPLARLNQPEVARLLEQLAEGQASGTLLRLLGHRLYEETEGNPLFLLETLKDLFERGALVRNEEGQWQLASLAAPGAWSLEPGGDEAGRRAATGPGARLQAPGAAAEGRLPIPATVQRVVRQRVARLRDEDRQLLQCASVIGRRFTFAALHRAMRQAMDATMEGLERLLAADLIRAQAHPPSFDFRHDKIREVVYEDLMTIRRQEWHRRVGEALEAIYRVDGEPAIEESWFPLWFRRPPATAAQARAEEHAEELAWHFHQAAPLIGPEKAARCYLLAGTRARALSAYEEAMSSLLTAQSLLEELPQDSARLALWGQVVEQLAPAYYGTGRVDAARQVLEDTIALYEEHGYGLGIARACTLLGQFYQVRGCQAWPETILALFERALAVCEAYGLEEAIVYPQSHLSLLLAWSGKDPERAEALARAYSDQARTHPDPSLLRALHTTLMWVATRRGNWEDVREAFEASLAVGGPHPVSLTLILANIEETLNQRGEDATFRDLCDDIAAGYARAGLEAPLQRWSLAPSAPALEVGEPLVCEAFENQDWDASLLWQDVSGRSRVDRVSRPGWLGLHPPEACDLWPEGNQNAPRLMTVTGTREGGRSTPGDRGNYVAQTRVELGEKGSIWAGLLLWRDEQDFVRLELGTVNAERVLVHLQACVAGEFRDIGRGHCERRPMWLRLERAGEEVRSLCSLDGENWLTCGSVLLPAGESEQVGLAAIHREPGAHAWFDSFELWRAATAEEK